MGITGLVEGLALLFLTWDWASMLVLPAAFGVIYSYYNVVSSKKQLLHALMAISSAGTHVFSIVVMYNSHPGRHIWGWLQFLLVTIVWTLGVIVLVIATPVLEIPIEQRLGKNI